MRQTETTVYFVRHASPDFNIREDAIRPLTAQGKEDTKLVTDYLKNCEIDCIYSSPYLRCLETIEDFANHSGLPVTTKDDFRERAVGDWVDDFWEFAEEQWNDFSYKQERGECLKEVQERNIRCLERVLIEACGKNIVVSTHGTALSTIANYYNPTFHFRDFQKIAGKMPFIMKFVFHIEEGVIRCVHMDIIEILTPVISFVVKGIIKDKQTGKILVVKRSEEEEINPNGWEFPGGKLEYGESVEEGLQREIREETGLSVTVDKFLYHDTFIAPSRRQLVIATYLCNVEGSPSVVVSEEHKDFQWVEKEKLEEILIPSIWKSVEENIGEI